MSTPSVAAVVVTYNRSRLLQQCLHALCEQTRPPDLVVVVDNASTDATHQTVAPFLSMANPRFIYERCVTNTGGAGGFARGLELAIVNGADWAWLMDDDALPTVDALANLDVKMLYPSNVYASAAVCGEHLSWPVTLDQKEQLLERAHRIDDLPPYARTTSHPFLGFLIHRELVRQIGLPDASFYISADDIEYSLRARRHGAQLVLIKASHIIHPTARLKYRSFLWLRIPFISLPPWRRYYDTRNRLLIARRYYGRRLWTEAIPGTLARMWFVVRYEQDRRQQLKALAAGMLDGLRNISGIRHVYWRLRK